MNLTPLQELYVSLFFIFCGAFFQFANPDESTAKLGVLRRLYSVLFSVVLVGALAAIALLRFGWNVWWVSFLGALLGVIADRFARSFQSYGNESNGLIDFIRRFVKVWQTVKNGDSNDSTP